MIWGLAELFWQMVFNRGKSRDQRSAELQQARLRDLLDRATDDPACMQRLVADPLGTARAAGIELGYLRIALHMPEASEASLGQMLVAQARSPKARTLPADEQPV